MSTILWRERSLLDLLLFKLEEERLLMAADLTRWLPRATWEVELVLVELDGIEEPRAGALDAVAVELGLQPGRDLSEVAAAAPPPWDGLLEQHRAAVLAATLEIGRMEGPHRDHLGQQRTGSVTAFPRAAAPGDHDPAPGPATASAPPLLRVLPGRG